MSTKSPEKLDFEKFKEDLDSKLALSGLSVSQYGYRRAIHTEPLVNKVAKLGEREPISEELREMHDWLRQATTLRVEQEQGRIEGPVASDQDIESVLFRFEPLYEQADRQYNG